MPPTAADHYPPHPAVDWATLAWDTGKATVVTTCPHCRTSRRDDAAQVRYRIRKGTYTGQCYRDRLIERARADSKPPLPHPAVDWDTVTLLPVGKQRLAHVAVTCPQCGDVRNLQRHHVIAKLHAGRFTGNCLSCSGNAKKREWVVLGPGRTVEPAKGYVRLYPAAVAPQDRAIFDAMRRPGGFVMEHRLVMARALGRPLRTNELVDHQDGVKTHNDPGNLRLYLRGRNMPGETTGYGTYYHEWQMALARIARLEAALAAC